MWSDIHPYFPIGVCITGAHEPREVGAKERLTHVYCTVRGHAEDLGGGTRSHDMKSKWSRATNSRYLMYSSSSSPFICPVELDQWYPISERPSTQSNPYVPEELWPLENCGGCGRMARNSQNAPNCRRHNSIHHL